MIFKVRVPSRKPQSLDSTWGADFGRSLVMNFFFLISGVRPTALSVPPTMMVCTFVFHLRGFMEFWFRILMGEMRFFANEYMASKLGMTRGFATATAQQGLTYGLLVDA